MLVLDSISTDWRSRDGNLVTAMVDAWAQMLETELGGRSGSFVPFLLGFIFLG